MQRYYPEYKFLQKPFLLNHHLYSDTNQGVFGKEETKGYVTMTLKIDVTNVYYVLLSLKKKTQNTHFTVLQNIYKFPSTELPDNAMSHTQKMVMITQAISLEIIEGEVLVFVKQNNFKVLN